MKQTRSQKEYAIQCNIADYLRYQYPFAVFRSDLSGIRLTMGQAVKAKRLQSSRAFPDMFILIARKGYHGMLGEIKVDRDEVYTKKHLLRQDEHIREQAEMIERLCKNGFFADFWLGFDDAKEKIDWYFI